MGRILAIDGHDAAGKTTLAKRLANVVGAYYGRPFGGSRGAELMAAYRASDATEVVRVGRDALMETIRAADGSDVVLDRGWITVATLVPKESFARHWNFWFPVALAWCDENTTRARLSLRSSSEQEPDDWHAEFLEAYLDRFSLKPGRVLRTDLVGEDACIAALIEDFGALLPFDPRTQNLPP